MKNWEKKFDDTFGNFYHEGETTDFTGTHVKDFIRRLLEEQETPIFKAIVTPNSPLFNDLIHFYNDSNDLVEVIIRKISTPAIDKLQITK